MRVKLIPVVFDIETLGVDPLEHEVVAIGYRTPAMHKTEVLIGDEQLIIEDFLYKLAGRNICLVGYNIRGFDVPFLTARALKHRIHEDLINVLVHPPKIDLMTVVSWYLLPSKQKFPKLSEIAGFLGIEYDTEYTEAMVPKIWREGNVDAIYTHCKRDVETEYALFMRLLGICEYLLARRYNLNAELEVFK